MASRLNPLPNPVTFNFSPGTAAYARPLPEFPLRDGDEVSIGPLASNTALPVVVTVGVGKLAAENGPYTQFGPSTPFQSFTALRLLSELWVKAANATDGVQVVIRPYGSQAQSAPPLAAAGGGGGGFVGGGGGGGFGGNSPVGPGSFSSGSGPGGGEGGGKGSSF